MLVVEEALLITGFSGLLGLSAAMGLVHIISEYVPRATISEIKVLIWVPFWLQPLSSF